MRTSLRLDKDERLRLMRAIHSVFQRDEEISSVEEGVLATLDKPLDLDRNDYKGNVHTKALEIAREVNGIADVRVRVYFMRIIHDVYQRELNGIFFSSIKTGHTEKFNKIYQDLKRLVEL